jgi:hypothetical protein
MLKPFSHAFAYQSDNLAATPVNATSSIGTAVTGGNSANGTPVAWGGGALGFEAQLLIVEIYSGSASNTDTRSLVDILIDPAGGTSWAATPLVSGILAGHLGSYTNFRRLYLPVRIPNGANLGMQARSLTTGRTHRGVMYVYGGYKGPGTWRCGSRVVSIGVDEANYSGTAHTAGNSGAWAASWTSIGSTTATNLWCHNLLHTGPNSGSWATTLGYYAQIGAGNNPLTLGDTDAVHLHSQCSTAEVMQVHTTVPVFADVPEGTQLQVRAKCSGTAVATHFAIYSVAG